jgi:acyl carrier protein
MPSLDSHTKKEIKDLVIDFFAEECDTDKEAISESTDIIEELDGDSLMLLALLEKVCKTYNISVELKTLAKHLMKKPANTIGKIIELTNAIVLHGDNIIHMDV